MQTVVIARRQSPAWNLMRGHQRQRVQVLGCAPPVNANPGRIWGMILEEYA
jgi:hypothetical protein